MCLLAVLYRVAADAPLIVAANREEAYARQGSIPDLINDPVPVIAGLDPVAGGTWLGVNAKGVLVGVTNNPRAEPPAQPRSRGLLARDLLQSTSAKEACDAAVRAVAKPGVYDGCNLLIGDAHGLYVVQSGEWLQVIPLPPGAHVLVNRAVVNDSGHPRIHLAQAWLADQEAVQSSEIWLKRLPQLCAFPGKDGLPAQCVHGQERGTVSSTIIALKEPLTDSRLWHAQGPPDRHPYQDLSHLFMALR